MERIDPNTRTWREIEERVNKRIENLTTLLSNTENGRAMDLVLKGQIQELRWMLTLAKPLPEGKGKGMGNLR